MDSLEHPRHWAWWKHARKAIEIADRLADIVHEIRRDMYRNQARGHETSSDRRLIHLGQQVVYAMNYHGFIHAELNMDATMDQLMLAAQELPQIRLQGYWRHIPSHIIWSYRYDDTLARIYLAMALLSKASGESTTRSPSAASISSPDDLIFDGTGALITWACKSALEASKRAMNGGGHRDTEVYDFHHYLRGVILKMLGSPPA
jgi:hypothetical protein